MIWRLTGIAIALLSPPALAQRVVTSPAQVMEASLGNPEMKSIFNADQAARQGKITDGLALAKADFARRARVRELLDAGELATKHDFYAAAFIFQHGAEAEDHLLAHVLAVRSLGLGMKEAEWIAAASLDRYLHSIARDQVYGTQYSWRPGQPATQGRYDRKLLTDQLRSGAGVETLAEQAVKLQKIDERNAQAK